MGKIAIELQCNKGHPMFLLCYRSSRTIKRIKGMLYCPECDKYFKDPRPKPIQVRITVNG